MAFFDGIGSKISKTSQGVVQKTKNTAEILKYNGIISEEKKRLTELYTRIGEIYCQLYTNSADANLSELVSDANNAMALITEYTDKINKLKGMQSCPNCGNALQPGAAFCSACGTRTEGSNESAALVCAKCGSILLEGSKFCVRCGAMVKMTPPASEDVITVTAPAVEPEEIIPETVATVALEEVIPETVTVPEETISETVTVPEETISETYIPEITSEAAVVTQTTAEVPTANICSVCGARVGNNLFCVKCGTRVVKEPVAPVTEAYNPVPTSIPAPAPTPAPVPTPDPALTDVCINCGAYVGDDLFCTKCGTKVVKESSPEPADVCVNCGAYVGDNLFCTKCGTKVVKESAPEVKPTVKHCPNCGIEFPLDSTFCTYCGAMLM